MENVWSTALWPQFGAAIGMIEKALVACPDALWREPIWPDPPPPEFPQHFAEFWYVTFHTIVWLDLYLAGLPEEVFAPPAPFAQGVLDSREAQPERPYTREELRAYFVSVHQKCRATLAALTDEHARRPVDYSWSGGQPISYLELLLYTMRHVQEHAAQLCLFLGQHGVPGAELDAIPRATDGL